ncbi:hypothetical protein BV22DRAFT_733430 [Leucogyrophana mollusca]|uniref:Uncharacterized protein n=1 Tax=Leucogyrophana mollusca TaxID=85980 RepID=A0ACB8B6X2_9AGAM|nr:hypothetical protein BV22DRAFT_733430 [Leucogyrophana mollusca]
MAEVWLCFRDTFNSSLGDQSTLTGCSWESVSSTRKGGSHPPSYSCSPAWAPGYQLSQSRFILSVSACLLLLRLTPLVHFPTPQPYRPWATARVTLIAKPCFSRYDHAQVPPDQQACAIVQDNYTSPSFRSLYYFMKASNVPPR